MPIQLTAEGLRKVFPKAPQAVIDAFVLKQGVLDKAGITHSRTRLAHFFANIEHECGGFALKGLTENINYTHQRAAEIWPGRFPGGAAQVRAKYGAEPGWQLKMFDDVYGSRMGNKPFTHDGSRYIGRGGPQWTGRDGYEVVEKETGLPAVDQPTTVSQLDKQPEVCTAFWSWKKLNQTADAGNLPATRKRWNGGHIGMADVEAKLAGNDPIIKQMAFVDAVIPVLKELPGSPPTALPPQESIDEATKKARIVRNSAGAGSIGGGAAKGTQTQQATTEQPVQPGSNFTADVVGYSLIGVCVTVFVVAAFVVAKKKAVVIANWF